ncbi:MAG: zinc-dependent metalloprotease, partial [Acidimicrobiales bacterium]
DITDLEGLQSMLGEPETLLGEDLTEEQRRAKAPLTAIFSALTGYVDHMTDSVGRRLVGSFVPLSEAMRRRRVEDGPGSAAVGRLLGIDLDEATYERGRNFVSGVWERAGDEGLARLWSSPRNLPTPAEVAAPGLWLARIDLPDDSGPGEPGGGSVAGSGS